MKKNLNRIIVTFLSLSGAGLIAITGYEGFRSDAYIPVKGDVPTIGFGSTENVKLGDKITVQEGLGRLLRDTGSAENAVKKCVHVPLSQNEYDAYVSFAFNVGSKAFCNSTLVKKLNEQDYQGACEELHKWVYIGKVKLNGLVRRREQEYQRCIKGH